MKTNKRFLISGTHLYIVKTKQYTDGHIVSEYIETTSSILFNRNKQIILLKVSKAARVEKMKREVREYMKNEAEQTWPSQYMKYFDEWYSNITEHQLHCFNIWRQGKMGPF